MESDEKLFARPGKKDSGVHSCGLLVLRGAADRWDIRDEQLRINHICLNFSICLLELGERLFDAFA